MRRSGRDPKYLARVRLEGCMDCTWYETRNWVKSRTVRTAEMGSNMIALGAGGPAPVPLACQAEVVRALAADVIVAEMVVEQFRI